MNKVIVIAGVLALGALGLAFVLKNQAVENTKTVMLEPSKVLKTAKSSAKNLKSVGSLEDLTKGTPEPRAVTTDAIVVPPKPASSADTSEPANASSSVVSQTPIAANETDTQTNKTAPEIASTAKERVPNIETSNQKETKPVVTNSSNQISLQATTDNSNPNTSSQTLPETTPKLPLRRSEGSVSIQAGAFKNAENAASLRAQLESKGFKASIELGTDGISRVIVGPYPNEDAAQAAASKISNP